MKKMYQFSAIFMSFLALSFTISSCHSTKNLAANKPAGETLVNVYCSGQQYQSDAHAFRSNSVGESMDQAISQKIALNNARTQLASEIKDVVQGSLDNYAKQQVHNSNAELEKNFQSLGREIINQTLVGTRTICKKVTKTAKGNYKTYVAIELASDKILNSLNNRLSQDTKLKIDYDYTKFKKEFEKELQNQKNK